jgi:hypothetical protein|tara:strand:+ start:699 stop:869 length:171 start_codon:yes stop_codon:yes gene_type:complete
MEIAELIKQHFLDSCSDNFHDLEHRRKIINTYKEQIKILHEFIDVEDKSLKRLEKK